MEAIPNEQPRQIKRPLVLASIMLAMFLAAIEATIVSTAMPSIAADLGGFSMYSWVFSAYLLTNAGTVLIFGKLVGPVRPETYFFDRNYGFYAWFRRVWRGRYHGDVDWCTIYSGNWCRCINAYCYHHCW